MANINGRKISSVKLMLRQYFNDNRPVKKDFLYGRVEADTIEVADKESFIYLINDEYRITSIGRTYRDE